MKRSCKKKWSFPLRISSVNVTKSAGPNPPETAHLVAFTEEYLSGILWFFFAVINSVFIIFVGPFLSRYNCLKQLFRGVSRWLFGRVRKKNYSGKYPRQSCFLLSTRLDKKYNSGCFLNIKSVEWTSVNNSFWKTVYWRFIMHVINKNNSS